MANFITTAIQWDGKENFDAFFKPMFIGKSPFQTQGIRIIPNIQSKEKLNYFGSASKVMKAYSKGFNPAAGSTFTQRDIDVYQMKAEMAEDANAFYKTVFEQVLGKGTEWDDLDKAPQLKAIIMKIWSNALESDIYRQFWLNDVYKETISGGTYTGTADVDYNAFNGIWKYIFDNAAASPSADQIKLVAISASAVAQVETVTLTGSSGTANILINGVNYLATWNTSLTQTAPDFVTTHATALALRGITVTSSVADVILTSSIAGQPYTAPTITNVIADLAGSVAHTTPNTAPSALSTNQALTVMDSLYTDSDKVLKQIPKNEKVMLVTDTIYENYQKTLRGYNSSYYFTSEGGRTQMQDGVDMLKYEGIPVLKLGWDVHLDADFPTGRPHRVIYTALQNLVLAIDAMSEFSKSEFWYNKDEQENRYRTQMKIGANYVHNKLMSAAY